MKGDWEGFKETQMKKSDSVLFYYCFINRQKRREKRTVRLKQKPELDMGGGVDCVVALCRQCDRAKFEVDASKQFWSTVEV